MQARFDPDDVDNLIQRIRVIIHAAERDGVQLRSKDLSSAALKLQQEIFERVGLQTLKYRSCEADLENAARICAHYAADAVALREFVSLSDEGEPSRWARILSQQLADAFSALAAVALVLSRAEVPLRSYLSAQRPPLEWRDRVGDVDELDLLFEATIRRYEQGKWKTAAEAARQITPEIVELAAEFANRRFGKSLLRKGTSKPLEWIRRHRRSKV